jgi:sugar lactone lactonase YvrE
MRSSTMILLAACVTPQLGCRDVTTPPLPEGAGVAQPHAARAPILLQGGPVVTFDASMGELPEGVATDRHGNLYVSIAPLGQVRKITPDGSQSVLAVLDPALAPGVPGALGLAVDRAGGVYAALASFNPATRGVWRIDPTGAATRLPGSSNITFANAIAIGPAQDALYVTDTFRGAVWRIPSGGAAEIWIEHELLVGTGAIRPDHRPLGANGIAYRHQAVFVANTDKGHVVRIPVRSDGSAGEPTVFAAGALLFSVDGIALDATGNVYAVEIGQHTLVRISRDGMDLTVLGSSADGLDCPAGVTFGADGADLLNVYVTNFTVPACPPPGMPRPGPAVVRIPVGLPGAP